MADAAPPPPAPPVADVPLDVAPTPGNTPMAPEPSAARSKARPVRIAAMSIALIGVAVLALFLAGRLWVEDSPWYDGSRNSGGSGGGSAPVDPLPEDGGSMPENTMPEDGGGMPSDSPTIDPPLSPEEPMPVEPVEPVDPVLAEDPLIPDTVVTKDVAFPGQKTVETDSRVLIMSVSGSDMLDYATFAMRAHGVTDYDVVETTDSDGAARTVALELTRPRTAGIAGDVGGEPQGETGRYSGILLTHCSLLYRDPSSLQWLSSMSDDVWDELKAYQQAYNVPKVCLDALPSVSEYGVRRTPGRKAGTSDTGDLVLDPGFRAAYAPMIPADAAFPVKGAFHNPVEIVDDEKAVPAMMMLEPPRGKERGLVGVIVRPGKKGGPSDLIMFLTQNKVLLHSVAMAPAWIGFLMPSPSEHFQRVYLTPHVDDILLGTELWVPDDESNRNGVSYRVTPEDYRQHSVWQVDRENMMPAGSTLKTLFADNGLGTEEWIEEHGPPDPLLDMILNTAGNFTFVGHTYSHPDLDGLNYKQVKEDREKNIAFNRDHFGTSSVFEYEALVPPSISGMFNGQSLRALWDTGIRYLVGDNSRPEITPPDPYVLLPTTKDVNGFDGPAIMGREATWVFYDVSTIEEEMAEFRFLTKLKPPTFADIMERDVPSILTKILLAGRPDPFMFHQANLKTFDYDYKGQTQRLSLLAIWLQHVIDGASESTNLPIRSLTMTQQYNVLQRRQARDECNVTVSVLSSKTVPTALVIGGTQRECEVPIDGVDFDPWALPESLMAIREPYGPQVTTWINVPADAPASQTVPLLGYANVTEPGWQALACSVEGIEDRYNQNGPIRLTVIERDAETGDELADFSGRPFGVRWDVALSDSPQPPIAVRRAIGEGSARWHVDINSETIGTYVLDLMLDDFPIRAPVTIGVRTARAKLPDRRADRV